MSDDARSLVVMDDAPRYGAPREPVGGWDPHEVWRTRIHEPRASRIEAVKNRSAGIVDDASEPRPAMSLSAAMMA